MYMPNFAYITVFALIVLPARSIHQSRALYTSNLIHTPSSSYNATHELDQYQLAYDRSPGVWYG
jgi:hypothetical protein